MSTRGRDKTETFIYGVVIESYQIHYFHTHLDINIAFGVNLETQDGFETYKEFKR